MSDFLSFFLLGFINIFISLVVCLSASVYLLSSGIKLEPFGPIDNPLSVSVPLGTSVGILHGLITTIVVCWYKSESVFGNGIAAFIAAEMLLLAALIRFFVRTFTKREVPVSLTFQNIGQSLYIGFFFFLFLSIAVFIPSFLVGLSAGTIQQFVFRSF